MEIPEVRLDAAVQRLVGEVLALHGSTALDGHNAESVLKCIGVAAQKLALVGALYELAIELPQNHIGDIKA